jgi:hypothetical protein
VNTVPKQPGRWLPRNWDTLLFIAESFGGCNGGGVAGGQQAGEECADGEQRGGRDQTARGKGALHLVGEDDAEKAVKGKTGDNARARADQCDARGDPQDMRARRAKRQAVLCAKTA